MPFTSLRMWCVYELISTDWNSISSLTNYFFFFFLSLILIKVHKIHKISSNYTIFLFVHALLLFRWPDRQSGSAPIFFFVSFEWPKFNTEEKNSKIVKYSRLFSIYSLSQKFMNLANKNCVINLLLLNKSLMV